MINPVKTQQCIKFTNQLHVSTGHGHHQLATRHERKICTLLYWDWDINALRVLLYKNVYITKVDSLGNENTR
jgi:hypothetical protein